MEESARVRGSSSVQCGQVALRASPVCHVGRGGTEEQDQRADVGAAFVEAVAMTEGTPGRAV